LRNELKGIAWSHWRDGDMGRCGSLFIKDLVEVEHVDVEEKTISYIVGNDSLIS